MKEQQNRSRKLASLVVICLALIATLWATALPPGSAAVEPTLMTVILVRHAEKEIVPPENKDPNLSAAGQARAQELLRMLAGAGVNAIYATQYKRTQQTAMPLADKLGIPVTKIEAKETAELVKQIRARPAGQTIFIAGHNNTVPEIIAALGGPKMDVIPETEYDNFYVLTVSSEGPAKLLKMKYGSAIVPVGNQGMTKP
jgi:broad specificity phosphatase PhoE